MAGLEPLKRLIYFEKQEKGSMMCAQHAINSLLQGPYHTAADLSQIAKNLDDLEGSVRDEESALAESRNLDDTGFFSVQVLESALDVWGLSLTRWRGEEMRPYQDSPHVALAFVFNYQYHWYTLRRFGPANPAIEDDPGFGHWFNLNSLLDEPEWVSKLYLGMVIQQAEADGYSVFVVVQKDPGQPLALPRTEADELAANLPEPSTSSAAGATTSAPFVRPEETGFEDEDYELQAALHASLMSPESSSFDSPVRPVRPPPLIRTNVVPLPPSDSQDATPTGPLSPLGLRATGFDTEDLDPVAATMARGNAALQEMMQEQQHAQRELWQAGGGRPSHSHHRGDDEEEEQLRRALAESEAMAKTQQQGQRSTDDDDDKMEVDVPAAAPRHPVPTAHHPGPSTAVYDDDDAELQAALKASLEQVPEGWTPPTFESRPPSHPVAPQPTTSNSSTSRQQERDESGYETDDEIPSSDGADEATAAPAAKSPTVEEMRLKRLARFGGAGG